MNANVILIGSCLGFLDYFKNTRTIVSQKLLDSFSLQNFLLGSLSSGVLTPNTTLVFDVHNQKDSEIKSFLENIIPIATDSFQNGWNAFSKRIVVLLPKTSQLNPVLNSFGINGFDRKIDVIDYFEMRDL
ncbi:MAG: hypothetical protein WCO66_03225 [Candidatus Absconditabacteria bacterium]